MAVTAEQLHMERFLRAVLREGKDPDLAGMADDELRLFVGSVMSVLMLRLRRSRNERYYGRG